MNYRIINFPGPSVKAFASIIAIVLACLWSRACMAQGTLPIQWMYNPINSVACVAYSPDGTLLAVAGNSSVQILNVATGKPIGGLPTAATVGVNSIAFSPDSKTLAVGGASSTGGVLETWNVSTYQLIYSLSTTATNVYCVAISPDGTTLADGGTATTSNYSPNSVLETWNMLSGRPLTHADPANTIDGADTACCGANYIKAVAFSPNGKTIAVGGTFYDAYGSNADQFILQTWDVSSGTLINSLNTSTHGSVNSVAFSPDGNSLAVGGDGTLQLWNINSKILTKTFNTTAKTVYSVAISPDGNTLAASGTPGVLGLWNVSSGNAISAPALVSGTNISTVAFSSDGLNLTFGGTFVDANNHASGVLEFVERFS